MKTFHVKFSRDFEADVHADTLEIAERLARQVVAQFPAGTARMISIVPADYVPAVEEVTAPPSELMPDERATAERNTGLAERVRLLTDEAPGAA